MAYRWKTAACRNVRAASTVEYGTLVGLIAVLAIGAILVFGGVLDGIFGRTTDEVAVYTDGSDMVITLGDPDPAPFLVPVNEVFTFDFAGIVSIQGGPENAIEYLRWRTDPAGGSLPPGMSLDARTGAFTGIPTEDGHNTFTVVASWADHEGRNEFTMDVGAEPVSIALAPSFPSPIEANVDSPFQFDFKNLATVSGGPILAMPNSASLTWSLAAGSDTLPDGLVLDATTGILSGTPTAQSDEDGDSFEMVAAYEDAEGRQVYTIEVGGALFEVAQIAAGADFSCAVTTTGKALCWGSGADGRLGTGTNEAVSVPTQVAGLTSGVTQISAGYGHACAVVSGEVWCWGGNGSGQLGNNSTVSSTTPVRIDIQRSDFTQVAVGDYTSCAVAAGTAYCWGANGSGQIGDNTRTTRLRPTAVAGLPSTVQHISTGGISAELFSCAVLGSGQVKCWGENANGRLGDGTQTDRLAPSNAVAGISSGATRVDVGGTHACAVASGAVRCWGMNGDGQLGDNTTNFRTSSVAVSNLASGVADVSLGPAHSCALLGDGRAMCWGNNATGQLGTGGAGSRTPVAVSGLSGGTSIAAGKDHGCAAVSGGAAWCWGKNTSGQIGDGSTTNRSVPAQVSVFAAGQ